MFRSQALQGELEAGQSLLLIGDDLIQLVDGVVLVGQTYFQVCQAVLLVHNRGPGLVFGVIFGIMTGFAVTDRGHFCPRGIEQEAQSRRFCSGICLGSHCHPFGARC